MGGHGFFVWGAYGVTFILLGGEVLTLLKRKRSLAKRGHREFETGDAQLRTSFQEIQ